mmetsp:Transcript_20549/g.49422  ORF Transcript_20549/g.49422 Transcript_20549/m.49422 type:complete len:237 (+) Transcript_20549:187-897(+)
MNLSLLFSGNEFAPRDQGERRQRGDPSPLPRHGDRGHDHPRRDHARENRRQGHRGRHAQEERPHGPGPRAGSGERNSHERGQGRPLLLDRADAEAGGFLLGAREDGRHEILQLVISQKEQQGNDGSHIPENAHGQNLRDGQSHPNSHGNGASQFHDRHRGYHGEHGEVGDAEGSKVVGHLLADVQVFDYFLGRLLGSECRGDGYGRYRGGDGDEGKGVFGDGLQGGSLPVLFGSVV